MGAVESCERAHDRLREAYDSCVSAAVELHRVSTGLEGEAWAVSREVDGVLVAVATALVSLGEGVR
jgi:hypothetical protein